MKIYLELGLLGLGALGLGVLIFTLSSLKGSQEEKRRAGQLLGCGLGGVMGLVIAVLFVLLAILVVLGFLVFYIFGRKPVGWLRLPGDAPQAWVDSLARQDVRTDAPENEIYRPFDCLKRPVS